MPARPSLVLKKAFPLGGAAHFLKLDGPCQPLEIALHARKQKR
jgi:hypothetical protein